MAWQGSYGEGSEHPYGPHHAVSPLRARGAWLTHPGGDAALPIPALCSLSPLAWPPNAAAFPISPSLQEPNKTSPHVTKSISSLLILVS